MDNSTITDTRTDSAPASTGCCGGKAKAQSEPVSETRVAQKVEDKPVKSGCCCSQS